MTSENGKKVTDDRQDVKTGRFVKGNKGGPGNPRADLASKIRQAMDEATDPDIIQGIWRKAQQLALTGNEKMIIYVLDRAVGKPKETIDLTGGTAHTIDVVQTGLAALSKRVSHTRFDLS